jgi:raffinose/stachyose/melibiose transport system permease protein
MAHKHPSLSQAGYQASARSRAASHRSPLSQGYIWFLLPGVVLFVLVILVPFLVNVGVSFTRWQGIGTPRWIGLDNYTRLLGDTTFWA